MNSIYLRECEYAWYNFGSGLMGPRPRSLLRVLSPYLLGVGIVQKQWSWVSFNHKFVADEESFQEHALKMNNPQVPRLMARAKFDYFIFLKSMSKLGLFWSEIACWLILWSSITMKSNISLIYFINNPLLYIHRGRQLLLNQEFLGVIIFRNFLSKILCWLIIT